MFDCVYHFTVSVHKATYFRWMAGVALPLPLQLPPTCDPGIKNLAVGAMETVWSVHVAVLCKFVLSAIAVINGGARTVAVPALDLMLCVSQHQPYDC